MQEIPEDISQAGEPYRQRLRERAQCLLSRAEMLRGCEKVLLKMYLENGISFRQLARLAGVNESSIKRRIDRIIKRLNDGTYLTCLHNRKWFTSEERAIARLYFVRAMPIKRIAEEQGLSFYEVRQTILQIRRRIKKLNRTLNTEH